MARSSFKEPVVDSSLLRRVKRRNNSIWSRSSIILPEYIGLQLKIHNGRNFIKFSVTENMVGHKFGEFALTRKKGQSKKKKLKKRK
jgi:small subunit ribosomal protein S19